MRRTRYGFTLIELLVSMGILALLLVLSTNLIVKNQQIANDQITHRKASEDARLALLRIGELTSSAAYVFPRGERLTLPSGRHVTTGLRTLALLVPWGTPFCNDGGANPYNSSSTHKDEYCAVVYTIENRAPYRSILGNNPKAQNKVLVEHVIKWVDWPPNTLPTRDFTGLSDQVGVVADSVVRSATNFKITSASISRASNKPIDPILATRGDGARPGDSNALIDNVFVEVTLRYQGLRDAKEQRVLLAKAVPRSAPPGTGN